MLEAVAETAVERTEAFDVWLPVGIKLRVGVSAAVCAWHRTRGGTTCKVDANSDRMTPIK